jgi:CRP-like cAMP-binding protein
MGFLLWRFERQNLSTRQGKVHFGEIILVDPGPRSASVLADEESHVLNINMRLLSALFTNDPSLEATVMRNLARALAQHLRRANTERAQG